MTHSTRAASLLLVLVVGCGAAGPPVESPTEVVTLEEMRIVARGGSAGGEALFDAYDAGQLFERGTALLSEGRCRDAVEGYYDRIRREFNTSRYLGPSLYNAGLCLQQGGEGEAAIPYYRDLLEHRGDSRDARHGALQLALVLVDLERWDEGLTHVERVLLREDLTAPERLEALARRAQVLLGLERLDDAERQARDALSYYRMQQRTAQIAEPDFAAAANYVLAETLRLRARGLEVPAGTAHAQHEVLDRRARLLLDAQREYFNTIGHTEPAWASAAGYRIGSMYEELWHAMRRAPVPPPTTEMNEATEELYREEYRAELARQIRPLLRHAIRYWELTLMMAERTGTRTEWADRTREDLGRMRALLLQQQDPPPAPATPPTPPEATPPVSLRLPALFEPIFEASPTPARVASFAAVRASGEAGGERVRAPLAWLGSEPGSAESVGRTRPSAGGTDLP